MEPWRSHLSCRITVGLAGKRATDTARRDNGHKGNSPENVTVVGLPREKLSSQAGGAAMTTRLELNLRAALCRQLAKREPANRSLWMAEAEHWLRLSKEKLRGEAKAKSVPARPVSARQAPAP